MAADEERAGVPLTHLDAELFDGAGVTKRDLVDYIDAVHPFLVRVLAGRALSVVRVRAGQAPFMQKHLPTSAPSWVATVTLPARTARGEVRYPAANDRRTLLWLANQRAVEYHPQLFVGASWDEPTSLVLDLDPPEGGGFAPVVAVARLVRQVLDDAGMASAAKTSGSKGVHVVVPLAGDVGVEDVAAATRAAAARAEQLDPTVATTAFIKADRGGRVFLDSTRVGGATVVAAYSPRARPGLPVSFPVAWDDLDDATPAAFTVRTAVALLDGRDRWQEVMPPPQALDRDLVAQGHTIPVARVQAMHEGKRRKRAAAQSTD